MIKRKDLINLPLSNRLELFKQESSSLTGRFKLFFPIENFYKLFFDERKIENKVRLCFVSDLDLPRHIAEELEVIFIKYFPYPDGAPILFFYPCEDCY